MRVMRLFCAVAVLATSFTSADASYLSSQDWNTAGDGLLTLDSNTGSLWLDLSVTRGLSYNYVISQLGTGGDFEGFRVATTTEVQHLFADAALPLGIGAIVPAPTPDLIANFMEFTSLLTATYAPGPDLYTDFVSGSEGYTAEPMNTQQRTVRLLYIDYSSYFEQFGSIDRLDTLQYQHDPSYSSGNLSTWLVHDRHSPPSVPEPTSMALAGFAGVGMAIGAWRRRRQQPAAKPSQTAA